jgi:predicted transport protein
MTDTDTKTRRPRSWQEMREQEIRWLRERTGEGLETWNARVLEQGFGDEASLRAWLTEQGVTGYPQMLLVMERFGYPDYLQATADELIEGQYADRKSLRSILDAIFAILPGIGDVEVQARKTYVALLTPRRTFAAVQPTTRSRIDLGVRLSPKQDPTARLERARNFGQSSVTHIIRLGSPEAVDAEVEEWLRRAYEINA